jgi:hypothetical protein
MLEMKFPDNNQPLEVAITRYRKEKEALDELLSEQSPDNEQIGESLSELAINLNHIHQQSAGYPQWRADNANIYMNNYKLLVRIWTERFPGTMLFDNKGDQPLLQQMTPTAFQPVPVPGEEIETKPGTVPGLAQGPQPPPIGVPLIQAEPPSVYAQAARVLLGLGGIALLCSGIATLVLAGIKLAAGFAAKEIAKKTADLVAKKAAEELAKQLWIEAGIYGSATVGTIALGGKMLKRARAIQTSTEQPTALLPA